MVRDAVIQDFLDRLSSKEPVPGGGGASALSGATGVSLSLMVISLTLGKKKYADVEEDLKKIRDSLEKMKERFLALADRDEEVFLPLSKAYGMKKDTEEEKAARRAVMEEALLNATLVPLDVMETAVDALECTKVVALLGSKLAVSDAGVAAEALRTALIGASYNVVINLNSMADEARKAEFSEKSNRLLALGNTLANETRHIVLGRLS